MFKVALIALALISTTPAFAQNAFGRIQVAMSMASLPGSLHDTMKAMSRALKSIDASDASKNAASAQAADQIADLSIHAKSFAPDAIKEVPADKRADALARYKSMMDQTAATAHQLADAFRKGDNAKAVGLMKALDDEKKRGHGEYK